MRVIDDVSDVIDAALITDVLSCMFEMVGMVDALPLARVCRAWATATSAKLDEWKELQYHSSFGQSGSAACQFHSQTHITVL